MNKNVLYVVLLLGLAGYYGYDQLYPKYEQYGVEIEELNKNIEAARATAPKLAELKRQERELIERLNASLATLPSGAELANLLMLVEPIINAVGISSEQIASKNISDAVEKAVYRVHPIRIAGIKNISMATITELLYRLRTFDRIISVKKASMIRVNPNRYDLDLELETYSYIETGEDLGLAVSAEPPPETSAQMSTDTGAVDTGAVIPAEEAASDTGTDESPATDTETPAADTEAAE